MPKPKTFHSNRLIKTTWMTLILILSLGASSGAFDEAYENLLSDIEKRGAQVPVTSCYIIDADYILDPDYNSEKHWYSLIFPSEPIRKLRNRNTEETRQGFLIEKNKSGVVVNMAILSFSEKDNSLFILDVHGGNYRYKSWVEVGKMAGVARQMDRNNSSKVTSANIRKVLKVLPDQKCT